MSKRCGLDAERQVLGAIMLDNSALPRVRAMMPDSRPLHDPRSRTLYDAMLRLDERGSAIDVLTLQEALDEGALRDVGGVDGLVDLDQEAGTAINVEHHVGLVLDAAGAREMEKTFAAARERLAHGESWRDVSADVQTRLLHLQPAPKHETTLGQAAKDALAEAADPTTKRRFPTGLAALDQSMGYLCGGHLVVLAARPGMGKTALALNIATHIARGATVVMFSLEMPVEQLAMRALCAEALVDSRALDRGHVTEPEIDRLIQACAAMQDRSMVINDSGEISIHDIRATCARVAATRERPLGAVVIDYLQLMGGRGGSREQVVALNSRALKALAKAFDVPVILLSQLNRAVEQRPDRRPLLSDLRESGAIEQDADIVLMLYRDEYYHPDTASPGIAEAIVAKHRHGPTGTVRLAFHPAWSLFTDMAPADGFSEGGAHAFR